MKRLFFLAAGMFAIGCEDYLFEGLLPDISTTFHTSVVAAAQGGTTYSIAYIASIPLCALLLTKRPVRQVLMMALMCFITGNLLSLFTASYPFYIMSRFMTGLGSGLFLPVAVGAAVRLGGAGFEGRASGLMWGANSAGAVFGVPAGLWLANQLGWQASIAFILILASLVLLGIAGGKEILHTDAPSPSLKSQIELLGDRHVLAVIGVTLLMAIGCLGLYTYVSQVLLETKNSSDLAYSLWSIGGLTGILGIGHILDRTRQPLLIMVVILAILLITIAAIPTLRWIPTLGLLPFFILGAMGWASVTPQQYSLIKLKPDHEVILVALNSSAVSLGSAVGTALLGALQIGGLRAATLPYVTVMFIAAALLCQLHLFSKRHLISNIVQ